MAEGGDEYQGQGPDGGQVGSGIAQIEYSCAWAVNAIVASLIARV